MNYLRGHELIQQDGKYMPSENREEERKNVVNRGQYVLPATAQGRTHTWLRPIENKRMFSS